MPREATVKDVLYGLEFMSAELVRRSTGRKASWLLIPGSLKVSPHVADAARKDPHDRTIAETTTEVRYGWAA